MSSSGAAPHSTHSPNYSGRGGDRTKKDAELRELRRLVRKRGRKIQELETEVERLRKLHRFNKQTAENAPPGALHSIKSLCESALDGGGDHDA